MPGEFKLDYLHPVEPILFWKFSNFWLSYWRVPIPYYPRGWKWENGRYKRVLEPMAFKLDHSQRVVRILIWNFSDFWLAYWTRPIPYYPGKWENVILQNKIKHWGFTTCWMQTGPFAACWVYFEHNFFKFCHSYLRAHFLIALGKWENGIVSHPE